eukprot:TRINITY_DN1755_c0_g1_i1.p2 TRINITY_DN1755_c0_g1~~TRINITY_DN1755_c0_g1_i1.p2  ORF type:complete len:109 (-),score=25.38 TRINITY_DN1755_c0_g1_i1:97-423(-)
MSEIAAIAPYLPSTPRQFLGSQPTTFDDAFFEAQIKAGVTGYSLKYTTLTVAFVNAAHRHLLPVFAWTVDAEYDLLRGIAHGHDAFITNDAIIALQMVQRTRAALLAL